jgi:hypothetical protein
VDQTGLSGMTDREMSTIEAHVKGEPHEGREREPGPPANELTRLSCYCRINGPGGRVRVLELFDYDSIAGDPDGT